MLNNLLYFLHMSDEEMENMNLPDVTEKTKTRKRTRPIHLPQYNVVLLDDNDHTYDYVIEMLMDIFRHSSQTAFEMACEVDAHGRVIVDRCN